MVEFEYQPYSKVIIHEIIKIPLEIIITSRTLGVPDGGVAQPIRWANGFTLDIGFIQPTDEVINQQLKGITHWAALTYAEMEEFKDVIQGDRAIRIPVIKAEGKTFNALGDWLRSDYEPSVKEK